MAVRDEWPNLIFCETHNTSVLREGENVGVVSPSVNGCSQKHIKNPDNCFVARDQRELETSPLASNRYTIEALRLTLCIWRADLQKTTRVTTQ